MRTSVPPPLAPWGAALARLLLKIGSSPQLAAFGRPLGLFLSYLAWTAGARLLVLTLVTYFLMSGYARLEDVTDAYSSNELIFAGLSASGFVLLLKMLNPLTSITWGEIFTAHRFEKRFIPGLFHGTVIAIGLVAAFLFSGLYKYLGYFIHLEDAPFTLLTLIFRVLTLLMMIYFDELIFRHKLLRSLRMQMPDIAALLLTSAAFCALKAFQFDLGLLQLLTLFLISLHLGLRALVDGDFVRGAGFWFGLALVFHPFMGLPIFGSEVSGIFLLKYQQAAIEVDPETARFLTGGIGGPFSSLVFQGLIAINIAQLAHANKKFLLIGNRKG